MAQVFSRSANSIARGSLLVVVALVPAIAALLYAWNGSSYNTGQEVVRAQPVPFSHKHHVSGLGIDCRYCHTMVEHSASAGIPPTHTCMTCHSGVWVDAPMLEPVRQSYREDRPIEWNRVYDLPDFVYFNHSIHVHKGVGCATCHGRVDQMPLMWQATTLQMGWCLDCHRNPQRYVRPREEIFNMAWRPPGDQEELGRQLVEDYEIKSLDHCYACHR